MLNKISILFLLVIYYNSAFADWAPLTISVDGVRIGEIPADLSNTGKPNAISGQKLAELLQKSLKTEKTEKIKSATDVEGRLKLEDLERIGLVPRYNDKELVLVIEIPLEMRVVKDFPVILAREKSGLPLFSEHYSGFLNLRGSVGYNQQTNSTSETYQLYPAEGQLELVQNLNFFTLESKAFYKEYDQTPLQRAETFLVHDFEEDRVRMKIGDFTPGVTGFQSSMQSLGLQVNRQFNIYPDRNNVNQRSTTIEVRSGGLLEVYINEVLISRLRVRPGPYNLKDLPLLYGQNKVHVVLKDDFGGQQVFDIDMLYDDQILPEGLNDFYYQVGRPSFYLTNEKKYDDNNYSSFYHKYGATNHLSLLINHQNFKSYNLFGVGAGILTKFGTNFIDLGYSVNDSSSNGHAIKWRYSSPDIDIIFLSKFRFFGSFESQSKDFKSLSLASPLISNFKERYDFGFQKQITNTSSLGFSSTITNGQNFGNDETSGRLTFQKQFLSNWRFDMTYGWSDSQADREQVQLSLNWLENNGRVQGSVTHESIDSRTSVQLTKNNKLNYNDFQIDAVASYQKPKSTGLESQTAFLTTNYYATKYEARAQLSSTSGSSNLSQDARLGLGTAIVWTQDGMAISRPVTDAFVIIRPEGLKAGQYLTIPDGVDRDTLKLEDKESFVYSNLTSYLEKSLTLDSTGLGVSRHLERESYLLAPRYRSGLFVPLKVTQSLLVRGRLATKNKELVKYAYGSILDSEGRVYSNNFFTDEAGNFLVDGLFYGKYQIVLADSKFKKIDFVIEDQRQDAATNEEQDDPDSAEFELGTLLLEKEVNK